MPITYLTSKLEFPSPHKANSDGIVAVGGDLSPQRILLAYQQGIFPWPHEGFPLLWFSPNPRFVLEPSKAIIGRSLRKSMRRAPYTIRFDHAFTEVMKACSSTPRAGQDSTWITSEMITGYSALHQLGYAHSVEAYDGDKLVGGLYGISLGTVFFGESMFALAPDASKICFATLLQQLVKWNFTLVDCQSHTDHLERFGATFWPRRVFLTKLQEALHIPTKKGLWRP